MDKGCKDEDVNWYEAYEDVDEMNFSHITRVHPCFDLSEKRENNVGRVHLPVSPTCNIQCKFCSRGFDKTRDEPGVTTTTISPEEGVSIVEKAMEKCSPIRVIGFAGPGDSLASDHAIKTLDLLEGKFPNLIKCLSTNGLNLKEKAERLSELGVKTITVSMHAVDPELASDIYGFVKTKDGTLHGREAARELINSQIEGIKAAVDEGIIIKVNTVLIPEINLDHVGEIAKTVKEAGASLINILPLIPQHEMSEMDSPSCEELRQAREDAEEFLPVFRHCKQCRADAIGIPGETECSSEIYEELNLEAPGRNQCRCL